MSSPSALEHKKKAAGRGPVAIVTVSDTGTPETDVNGKYLCEPLQASSNKMHSSQIIRDELTQLERVLNQLAAEDVQVVFFTGGTGTSRGTAFSNPRMSLKSVRAEKGRLQGEDLLSERIEGFERGGGQGGGGSCAHSGRDHEGFLELPLPPPLNVESGAVRPR